ncbi:MAG: hypothetical protein AAF483_02520 [Planctomycetota bacterium]
MKNLLPITFVLVCCFGCRTTPSRMAPAQLWKASSSCSSGCDSCDTCDASTVASLRQTNESPWDAALYAAMQQPASTPELTSNGLGNSFAFNRYTGAESYVFRSPTPYAQPTRKLSAQSTARSIWEDESAAPIVNAGDLTQIEDSTNPSNADSTNPNSVDPTNPSLEMPAHNTVELAAAKTPLSDPSAVQAAVATRRETANAVRTAAFVESVFVPAIKSENAQPTIANAPAAIPDSASKPINSRFAESSADISQATEKNDFSASDRSELTEAIFQATEDQLSIPALLPLVDTTPAKEQNKAYDEVFINMEYPRPISESEMNTPESTETLSSSIVREAGELQL